MAEYANQFIYEGIVLERKPRGKNKDQLTLTVGQGFGLEGFAEFYVPADLVGFVPAEGQPVRIGGILGMTAGTAEGQYGSYGRLFLDVKVTRIAPVAAEAKKSAA